MQPDIQDDATPGQREYAFAKAYTEARARRGYGPRKLASIGWLGAVALPILCAAVTPWLSTGAAPGWMRATERLGEAFAVPLPLRFVAREVFGNDQGSASKFMSIAGIDLLSIVCACLCAFSLLPRPRLRPKPDGIQISFLNDLTKGFRLGKTRRSLRVGGAAGGVVSALFMLVLILGGLHFLFLRPMQEGRFFADVRVECAVNPAVLEPESSGRSATPHCLETSAWHLAWRASFAGLAVPLTLLLALNYAIYPVWLALGRPMRS